MNVCVKATGVRLAVCCVRPSRVAGGTCSQLRPVQEEGKALTVDELQLNPTKHPVICATCLGAFWNSFLEEKNIFLNESFELGTLNLSGCSQKCATVQHPLTVAEGCSKQSKVCRAGHV